MKKNFECLFKFKREILSRESNLRLKTDPQIPPSSSREIANLTNRINKSGCIDEIYGIGQ